MRGRYSRYPVDLAGSTTGEGERVDPPTLTPTAFVEKWRGVTTSEKASSQSHFIDLCRLLGEPTPHVASKRLERQI